MELNFLTFRVLQAMFGGAATLVIPGTIRLLFGKDTVKGLSYVSSIMMIAPMLAPSLGGLVLSLSSWRMIFILLAAYAALIFVFSYRFFPAADKIEKISMPLHQVYFSSYKRIFSTENIRRYLLISMLASFTFFTYITGVAFVYIKVLHFSEFTFGLVFGINVLVLMTSNFVNSKLTPIYGEKTLLGYYWIIAISFSSALILSVYFNLSWIFILLSLIPLMGCLMAMIISADSLILQSFSKFTGTATAVIGTLRFASGALAGPLLALLYDGSAKPFAVLICSGVMAIGMANYLSRDT
ncbi:MAG: MFS transporter [Enterobacterales bacterium]|nr:MFS transporter [Enterobacterales bacterium]